MFGSDEVRIVQRQTRSRRRVERGLAFIPFQIPTLVEAAPTGPGWVHEIKLDGYRTELIIEDGEARAFTRNGYDWSNRYPHLVAAARALPLRRAIFDGEAVVQNELGVTDFHALRSAMTAEPHRLLFFAFDLLHIDGADIRRFPLVERQQMLATILIDADPHSAIHLSSAIEGDGKEVFAAAENLGVEGIVSKRADGRYESGRSRQWVKTKAMVEGEFVVVGVEPNPGGPPFALLAREEAGGLVYVGSAFVTLPRAERDRFWDRSEALKIEKPVIPDIRRRKVGFLKPEMRVRAKHLRGGDMLRHASLTAIL